MHLFHVISIFVGAVFAIPTLANGFAHDVLDEQMPIAIIDEPITKTILMTKTHYEINVVSTVYRTKTESHTTKTVGQDPVRTLAFWVEGAGCDMKACTICRLLNNCLDDEENCSECDEAYYCNNCGSEDDPSTMKVTGSSSRKACSLGTGRTFDCDELDQENKHDHARLKTAL